MIIGILKEPIGEKRVAMLPAQLTSLLQAGVEVLVENEAGVLSFAADADYESAGAKITSRSALIQTADILVGFWPSSRWNPDTPLSAR